MSNSTTQHTVQVGDLFVESWGYDQTNYNFYEVVATTRTGVRLREIAARRVESESTDYTDALVPIPGQYIDNGRNRVGTDTGKGFFKKVSTGYQGEPWINLTSYSGAAPWGTLESGDRSVQQTGDGYGH